MTLSPASPGRKTRETQSEREASILQSAQNLLANNVSFGIRIADIAKGANVSVGTFYTHFESKEDLILCLVTSATRQRRLLFEKTRSESQLNSAGKLIVGILRNHLFTTQWQGLAAAEELTALHAIWSGATEQHVRDAHSEMDRFGEELRELARSAIRNGHMACTGDPETHAKNFDKAAWFLMAGCAFVFETERIMGREFSTQLGLPESLLVACQSLLVGFGWNSPNPAAEMQEFARIAGNDSV